MIHGMINYRGVGWAERLACLGETSNTYKIFVGNRKGKKFGTRRRR